MKPPSPYDGIVVVDKPAAMTSHDVVDTARRCFRTRRVGHTGTLDPDATGVLVLCIGSATRLAEFLSASSKHYVARVLFGLDTDTQDASGTITCERDAAHLTREVVEALLGAFRGTIYQIPPMVSARHHEGRRLHELAREGIVVERDARAVEISDLDLTEFDAGARPVASLDVTCSTGTYVRALAADLGAAAGTGAIMQSLRRTWVGRSSVDAFTLADAVTLDQMRALAETGRVGEIVRPPADALRHWPRATLDAEALLRIRQGRAVELGLPGSPDIESAGPQPADGPIALLAPDGQLAAVAKITGSGLRPVKVFNVS